MLFKVQKVNILTANKYVHCVSKRYSGLIFISARCNNAQKTYINISYYYLTKLLKDIS